MSTFKKTNFKSYTKSGPKVTPDVLYWKKLCAPAHIKEFGPIDYVDFSPLEPHYFAVTCSAKVQIYNPITRTVHKNLNRFRETAYGGSFRSDGQLLCVGGEEPQVKLFDVHSKALLRVLKGHTGAVHRCFFTVDKYHIASFSDDKSVALWDIPTENRIATFAEHKDYVRAGAVSPISQDTILSGGYDSIVKMYDTRINTCVFSVDHGAPVESVLFLPTGGIFLSAGGTDIRVWDAFAGGRLLARLSNHHKTVTCLCLASENRRFMSGSLDKHVKVYDIATYQLVHTIDYTSSILSMGISAGDDTVVVGMVDGMVTISRREQETKPSKRECKKVSYRYQPDFQPSSVDIVVPEIQTPLMEKYDFYLCKFEYTKALDAVLKPYIVNKTPAVTASIMQELIRRKGLKAAMAGREGKSLILLLRFLIKYIGDYRFTRLLMDVTNMFLDVYESVELSPEAGNHIAILRDKLKQEEQLIEEMLSLQGVLQMLLAGSTVAENTGHILSDVT